jgi:hypothetical protein
MKDNAAIIISDVPFYWALTMFVLGLASVAVANTFGALGKPVLAWLKQASLVPIWVTTFMFSISCVVALVAENFPLWLLVVFYLVAFANGVATGVRMVVRSESNNKP